MAKKNTDQDAKRYEMLKKVLMENRIKRLTIDSLYFQYLEQFNKATYPCEMDDVIDAILENEKRLGKRV